MPIWKVGKHARPKKPKGGPPAGKKLCPECHGLSSWGFRYILCGTCNTTGWVPK